MSDSGNGTAGAPPPRADSPPSAGATGAPAAAAPDPRDAAFPGRGEMAARCRAFDWAATPLGPVAGWSHSLRTTVAMVLQSRHPMFLFWGPAHVQVYNDAYRPSLGAGDRADRALGAQGPAFWTDIWGAIGPEVAQVLAGGPATWHEDQHLPIERNGRLEDVWWTYSYSPVPDDDGRVAGVLVVCQETTASVRARAEREGLLDALERERTRLADVFRQSPTFLAVLRGPDHVFDLVNDAYYALVGRRAVIGRPVVDALPEVRDQGFVALLDGVLATGTPFVGREVPIQFAPGGADPEQRFVDFVYLPLVEADGTGGAARAGVIAHGTDVTAQVLARREVERLLGESEAARAEAEAAGRLKSEFLATMSHEFRTPLNAILGYTQLLDMGILGATTPAQHAHLERLQASARHLLQLVDDVLDVAKVDADRMAVRRDRLATGAAVGAALALVQPQATAKGIRVEDLGVPGPGVPYLGDEHRVRQVLVNLLANAVKFTPPGGVITVTCGAAADPDPDVQRGEAAAAPWAFMRIADTGPGVAPALRSRLFEPFTQGDGALTRTHGGTGLGLAISRRLARLMGGDLIVERPPDGATPGGATFTLWLPAPADARDAVTSHGVTPLGPSAAAAERSQRRTPAGMVAVRAPAGQASDSTTVALDAGAYAVLHALGTRLAADAETVAERYVAALRASTQAAGDDRFPGARALPAVQLRDHATPVVGLLATQLMTIGETRGRAPELLADGAEAQRFMAELHGAQRHRLGWTGADIARETPLLVAEVERALHGALRTVDAPDAGEAIGPGVDAAAVRAAAQYASDVSRHVLDRAMRTAIRAYDVAAASALA